MSHWMPANTLRSVIVSCASIWFAILATPTTAQLTLPPDGGLGEIGQLGDKANQGGFGGFSDLGGSSVTLSGQIKISEANPRVGKLSITAEMSPGWHMYSVTQGKDTTGSGPRATTLTVAGQHVTVTGSFTPDTDPEAHKYDDIWPGLTVEEHLDFVTWSAPVEIAFDGNIEQLQATIHVEGQVCKDACQDVDEQVVAKFTGYYKPPGGSFQSKVSNVEWQGFAEPSVVKPGGSVRVHLRAEPTAGFHIYQHSATPSIDGNKETLIVLSKRQGWKGRVQAQAKPVPSDEGPGYHEEPIIWTVTLDVPADAEPGQYSLGGYLGFQTCNEGSCKPPDAAKFDFDIQVGDEVQPGKVPLAFGPASYKTAADLALRHPLSVPLKLQDYAYIVVFGLLGGLILNLMPCVLPVIGLKVMSFAEQANKSRWESLKLNLWYSAGLLSVFLILATMAAFLQMSWGEQFTYTWFKVAMTGLVFGMALSFLDVWEIPIPGFAGSGASQKLQEQEGAAGAFSKGVFTTLLATPCSGPFLGALFAYTLSQPPAVSYLIYMCIGLGMASPFLIAGAFPNLVKWLPAPGAWMETFKHLMGFVLLGTVVFQFSTIKPDYFIATLALMMAIWFALWLVGQIDFMAPRSKKVMRWAFSIGLICVSSWASFEYLTPHQKLLPWKPYSPAELAKAQAEGKTVIVDYTAAWCLNCKLNMRYAIDTHKVLDLVEEYGVVPMLADWTDRSPEIKRSLAELNSSSIPVFAVYPADSPEQPIVLKDLLAEKDVLEAIREAGPSKGLVAKQDADGVAQAKSNQPNQRR